MEPQENPVTRAAQVAATKFDTKRGPNAALADLLGVSPQAVSLWVATGYLPVDRAIEVEDLLGIPRKELIDPELVQAICGSC